MSTTNECVFRYAPEFRFIEVRRGNGNIVMIAVGRGDGDGEGGAGGMSKNCNCLFLPRGNRNPERQVAFSGSHASLAVSLSSQLHIIRHLLTQYIFSYLNIIFIKVGALSISHGCIPSTWNSAQHKVGAS